MDDIEVYNDGQNIHNHSIQESFRKSLSNLLTDKKPLSMDDCQEQVLNDTILTQHCKKSIIEYINNDAVHSYINLTFGELFQYVWTRIQNHTESQGIKEILNDEMSDALCKCFTGRLTRLVNCLNGFYDDIVIKIADNQQIGNIIVVVKEKLLETIPETDSDFTNKWKDEVRTELVEREYDSDTIDEWVQYIY